jgi:hypothetical protein
MKKEDLVKGKKYQSKSGKIFTFEEFDKNENACFLYEGQTLYDRNEKGLIVFPLKHVLEEFTPIEELENDLNLSVGDSVYLGRRELMCTSVEDGTLFPYELDLNGMCVWATKDGRVLEDAPPIFSRDPYDLPEMVYEKPIQVGEMVFAWTGEEMIKNGAVAYGKYKGKNKEGSCFLVGLQSYEHISKTSPFDETN